MWPCAARPASTIAAARAVITSVGAKTSVGSRLPWTARSPTSGMADDSGVRQSTPTTSAPASAISGSRLPVFTPKWIRGTPSSAAAASTRAEYGITYRR